MRRIVASSIACAAPEPCQRVMACAGVSCDADSSFDVGERVFVPALGISAGGVLVEKELGKKLVMHSEAMKSTYIDHPFGY